MIRQLAFAEIGTVPKKLSVKFFTSPIEGKMAYHHKQEQSVKLT